jgi:glycosyltransferase involved in cell wall biosynthesis
VRIVVVGPLAASVYRFRAHMMKAMVDAGHDVLAVAPDDDPDIRSSLADMGIDYATVRMSRTGLNPIADLLTTVALTRTLRSRHADVILAFGAKPVVYGLAAAVLSNVSIRAAMITGTGSALLGGDSLARRSVSRALRIMYRGALRHAHVIYFQNGDDERLFRSLHLIGDRPRIVRIEGSGVDLDHFAVAPFPSAPVTFLMIARLIRDKGVVEYADAARSVRRVRPDLRFKLLGGLDSNPTGISSRQLKAWQDEGAIEYLGSAVDVRPALASAHVFVLPSYGEGMPRAVLEAMSMGRPILTTDVPGCRETVRPSINGYLVPPRSPDALAEAMHVMAGEAERLDEMGRASRSIAEERFDVHEVNRRILDSLLGARR